MSVVIPKPLYSETVKGSFIFNPLDTIKESKDFPISLSFLSDFLKIKVNPSGRINFSLDKSLSEEEYILDIKESSITITASSDHGAFYGVQTLRQILPPVVESMGVGNAMLVEGITIKDKPEYSYRGFMFDVARHFFDKEEVKRMICLISLYKFNTLHLHLSDDQGFRLDIKKYPKLKEISTKRSGSEVKGFYTKKSIVIDDKEVKGYYTQEDIDDILMCAKEHFVKVIPEIDMPGHLQAALAAYPEYLCKPREIEVRKTWGISNEVLCIGNPESILFAHDISIEVLKMFHSDTIHIGGDECPTSSYEKCPKCKKLMKDEGIKNIKDLQGYFTEKLSFILTKEGYKVRVWNEAISSKLPKEVEVQYWNDKKPSKIFDKIKEGTKVIVSPFMSYYLDYTYTIFDLENTYNFDPHYKELGGLYKENILGVEAPIWTEWVKDRERLDFQVFPRLLAVSEGGWTPQTKKDYNDFIYRLDANSLRLNILGVNEAPKECYMQKKIEMSKLKTLSMYLKLNDHPSNTEYYKFKKEKGNGRSKEIKKED